VRVSDPQAPGFYQVKSLGCKVNQAEAASLRRALEAAGLRQAGRGQAAQVAVLLTCTVTSAAARQSRQAARRLARANPEARLVITGCDVQADHQTYIDEGFLVLGRADLADAGRLILKNASWPQTQPQPPEAGAWCPGWETPGPRRTRGLLKVQDGCNANCAYCIVPQTRGKPRSLDISKAAQAFVELGEAGAAEVVLTGIHLGRWGWDLEPRQELCLLLRGLLEAHPGPRLRLSSLESAEITDELLDLLAAEPRLCPHLHVPLQTGSDKLLKAMGRPYKAAEYAAKLERAAELLPGLCLGADVLVGLPGEDEQAFAETKGLLERLPIAYLHVFPYSPRPGTRAATMPNRPKGPEVKQRAEILRELGRAKRLAFVRSQVGRELSAVVEGSGLARTDNYCLVELGPGFKPGQKVRLKAQGVNAEGREPCLAKAVML
jgi:threonylcarbamoyladenosine tRNA methylthiotransferase MtaB